MTSVQSLFFGWVAVSIIITAMIWINTSSGHNTIQRWLHGSKEEKA